MLKKRNKKTRLIQEKIIPFLIKKMNNYY
jgi:hypothetical protein